MLTSGRFGVARASISSWSRRKRFRVHVSYLSRVQTSDEIGQIRHQHPQPAFESEGLTLRAGFTSYARHWQPLPYERATGDEQVQVVMKSRAL